MGKNRESMAYMLLLVYLTCYFTKLFDFPDFLMLVLGAGFCFVLFLKQKKIRVDLGLILLAITMFSYCIIVFGFRAVAIMMPYIPVLMYVLSHYVMKWIKPHDNFEIKLMQIIYALVLGHAIHGILNSWTYLAGYRWEGTRGWMDIWSKDYVAGTQLTFYFITVFSMLFPAIVYFRKRKVLNAAWIAITFFLVYSSLATRTRTTLLVLILVFGAQMVLYAIIEREKVLKILTPKIIGMFAAGMLAVIAISFLALKDNEMIRIFIDNMGKDGGILNNIRFRVQKQAISQLFTYPMGGNQMILDLKLCHNTWLDIANTAGLIPFFAFLAYTLWSVYEMIRFILKKEIATETKIVFAGLYFAYFLYYMVESAVLITVHFLAPWVMINGLIHGYLTEK